MSDHDARLRSERASAWLHRVRLRVFALLVGTTLAVIGAVSWAALPLWPVLGVAVATVAFVFNGMTSRLAQPVCWTCGEDLPRQQGGEYGVMCSSCGSLNMLPDSPGEPPANA